ncbi:MAG: Na+ dependent nucleoside transporter domain protein [Bacteroidetes bacterium]|jgi:CNT family concentrative nucleoside transporter|nr:Na+ dependent nucleoside transporter domain protein [Bacteroidota bacterium]
MSLLSLGHGLFGLALLIGIAWLFSNNRRRVNWRLVLSGFGLQFAFAVLILQGDELSAFFGPLGWVTVGFEWISYAFVKILAFTTEGAKFVFGNLAVGPGTEGNLGFFFAFQVLPTIIFFASLMSVMYYLGIMQRVVQGMAWVMARVMGTSGAESLSNTANIFVGQTEAPLMIRPFLKGMTNSELLTIMVGGMCTIAGGVMAAYVQMLGFAYAQKNGLPLDVGQAKFAAQLLGASIMAAPAGLAISKLLFPETGDPETKGTVRVKIERTSSNIIEAAASGASDGLQLALNVGAMLLAFIALIALVNYLLTGLGDLTGLNAVLQAAYGRPLSLELLFGLIFQFLAFGIGVPWGDALNFGSLIGTKIVLNEFVAYLDLSRMITSSMLTSDKSVFMAAFALCGFANFSSIAIQIGGISPLAPDRRKDLAALGLKAVLGGTLANLSAAAVAGIFFG